MITIHLLPLNKGNNQRKNEYHRKFHCPLLYYFIYSTLGLIIHPVVVNLIGESLQMTRFIYIFLMVLCYGFLLFVF